MTGDQATVGAFCVTVLVVSVAIFRWGWPRVSTFFAGVSQTFETINGKPAVLDRAGRELEAAEPSLRVQLADIKATVSDQAVQNERIAAVEVTQAQHARILADHAERFSRLDAGQQLERIVTKTESQQAWAAVEAIAKQEDHG